VPKYDNYPKYAQINLATYNIAGKNKITSRKIKNKNENKYLYRKKDHLNKELYHIHTQTANIWKDTWDNIEQAINQKLQNEIKINTKNNGKKYVI
jgi:hypothetical protein